MTYIHIYDIYVSLHDLNAGPIWINHTFHHICDKWPYMAKYMRFFIYVIYDCSVWVAHRHGLGVHSYADDSQLYFHADISVADDKDQHA